jgi:chromosome partitioning protein
MVYKTLLIDFVPQGNSSMTFNVRNREDTIYEGIIEGKCLRDIVVTGNVMGDIVPANGKLSRAIIDLNNMRAREYKLKQAISEIEKDYEVIIVDSGPSKDVLMDNVLTAVDGVVIPMEADDYAIGGLVEVIDNILDVKKYCNPHLKVYGVLLTLYDKSQAGCEKVKEQFESLGEDFVVHRFKTIIRKSPAVRYVKTYKNVEKVENMAEKKLVNAQGSIFRYGKSNAAEDYGNFAKELVEVIWNEHK